jgi:hypothetical protein
LRIPEIFEIALHKLEIEHEKYITEEYYDKERQIEVCELDPSAIAIIESKEHVAE